MVIKISLLITMMLFRLQVCTSGESFYKGKWRTVDFYCYDIDKWKCHNKPHEWLKDHYGVHVCIPVDTSVIYGSKMD